MTGYLARRRLTGHVAGDGFVCNWAMTPVTLLQVRSTFLRHPQRGSGRLMFEGEWHRHQSVNRLTQPCTTVRRRPQVMTFRLKCKTAQATFICHQVTVAAATTHRFHATATRSGQTMSVIAAQLAKVSTAQTSTRQTALTLNRTTTAAKDVCVRSWLDGQPGT